MPGLQLSGRNCCAKGAVSLLAKTGVASSLLNSFGEIEILDDLVDHWSSPLHNKEKIKLLHMLQASVGGKCGRLVGLAVELCLP